MKNVRMIIEANAWVDGSGWSYSTTIEDEVQEVTSIAETAEDFFKECDSNYLEGLKVVTNADDIKYMVSYCEEDDEEFTNPITSFEFWASEITDLEKLSDFSNITIGSMKAIAEVLNCKVDDLI